MQMGQPEGVRIDDRLSRQLEEGPGPLSFLSTQPSSQTCRAERRWQELCRQLRHPGSEGWQEMRLKLNLDLLEPAMDNWGTESKVLRDRRRNSSAQAGGLPTWAS